MVPFITSLFILLSHIYPLIYSAFLLLIFYDFCRSKITQTLLDGSIPFLSITKLTTLSRHMEFKVITNLVISKTAMTATGRARLLAGTFTGAAWLYNAHRDRQAMDARAAGETMRLSKLSRCVLFLYKRRKA